MSDPTQKKLEAKSVGYKIGVAESERSLSNLSQAHWSRRQLLRSFEGDLAGAHRSRDCQPGSGDISGGDFKKRTAISE